MKEMYEVLKTAFEDSHKIVGEQLAIALETQIREIVREELNELNMDLKDNMKVDESEDYMSDEDEQENANDNVGDEEVEDEKPPQKALKKKATKKVTKKKTTKKTAPKKEEAKEDTPQISGDDVLEACKEVVRKEGKAGRERVLETLQKFGAEKFTELKDKHYSDFMGELNGQA